MNLIKDEDLMEYIKAVGDLRDENFRWHLNYAFLCEYMKNAGGIFPDVLVKFQGERIGEWLSFQRVANASNTLSEDKVVLLKEINFPFLTNKKIQLKSRLELLEKFKKEKGRYPKYSESYEGFHLGRWFISIKKEIKRPDTSLESIKILKDAGFPFGNARKKSFEENLDLLKYYIKKNKSLPKKDEVFLGVSIGNWINNQWKRYQNKNINKDQYTSLKNVVQSYNEQDLSMIIAERIRKLVAQGASLPDLSLQYLISEKLIQDVVQGKVYVKK